MRAPRFSVIIPVYRQAHFLAEAIQSVLDQTFEDFEIIVVNDASPDNVSEVIAQFTDPRIKYSVHEKNKGLPGARNTGLLAATGELIALLDADDYFQAEKLAVHHTFLDANPSVDVTYNARFELHHCSSDEIRGIYQPPLNVDIRNLLQGFQFSPSDMVLRSTCLGEVGFFDDGLVCGGEDLDYPLRLALYGKKFARVDKALNYRRFHSGRKKKNLLGRLDDYTNAVSRAFNDPKFPHRYLSLKDSTLSGYYSEVAVLALCQEEYNLGNGILRKIQRLDPSVLSGWPAPIVNRLLTHTIRDRHLDHEKVLNQVFANLDAEFQSLSTQLSWAVTTGYLQRGAREIIWNRPDSGLRCLEIANQRQAVIEQKFLDQLVTELTLISCELGLEPAMIALNKLEKPLHQLGGDTSVRHLYGHFAFNNAFALYRTHRYQEVPRELIRAVKYQPGFLTNRGFYSVMIKSFLNGKQI
jgi:glycosyltransferase involved in cell wall biosynthesis